MFLQGGTRLTSRYGILGFKRLPALRHKSFGRRNVDKVNHSRNDRRNVDKVNHPRNDRRNDHSQVKSPSFRERFVQGNFSRLTEPTQKVFQVNKQSDNITSFDDLRIFPTVRAAMVKEIKGSYNLKNTYIKEKDNLDLKPTPVQIAAIRKISRARTSKPDEDSDAAFHRPNDAKTLKTFVVGAETGSGKTWAYLAPLLSKLKEHDLELFHKSPTQYQKSKGLPHVRSLILLPTHELVEQVYETLHRAVTQNYDLNDDVGTKFLKDDTYSEFLQSPDNSKSLNMNVMMVSKGDSHFRLYDHLQQVGRIDVLITTPAKLTALRDLHSVRNPLRPFGPTQFVVVDEADSLMNKSWMRDTKTALNICTGCKDLVFCSATLTDEFTSSLSALVKDDKAFIKIVTPSLHKIPKQIVVRILDAAQPPYLGSKSRCLAQAIYAIHNDGTEEGYVKRILVFVNDKNDVKPLVETLTGKYHYRQEDVIGVTGDMHPQDRLTALQPFLKPAGLIEDDLDKSKIKVLVTTDLMSRGLNFSGVKNVILMDVPYNSADLVHRIGRTGRMRQSGRVFIIKDRKTKNWVKGLPNVVKRNMVIG